jgi:DNA polymerase I-like protein with 3'-5' exonuclease and polymerase domains
MRQPEGIGGKVIWGEPAEYVESFLGFRRYFTLENMITKALYNLSAKPAQGMEQSKAKCLRRDRVQFAAGAVCSALYGAAFQIQAGNQRAAANHEIQSPGGQITKRVQRKIWDLQPAGVHVLYVAPMNVHDELMTVTHPDYVEPVAQVVKETVEGYREQVPLIGMTWNKARRTGPRRKVAPSP